MVDLIQFGNLRGRLRTIDASADPHYSGPRYTTIIAGQAISGRSEEELVEGIAHEYRRLTAQRPTRG
jgi:hypothetical protein